MDIGEGMHIHHDGVTVFLTLGQINEDEQLRISEWACGWATV
jgi:hypothetical protein